MKFSTETISVILIAIIVTIILTLVESVIGYYFLKLIGGSFTFGQVIWIILISNLLVGFVKALREQYGKQRVKK